jgi:hypothetical protein
MKHLLRNAFVLVALLSLAPVAEAQNPRTCGNGNVQKGEWCDTGGDTATCDADCSPVDCGDGHANAAAGEACDAGGETAACDADCTLPGCGDGTVNRSAGEDCDDGTDTARCNADCTPALCGDGYVNVAAGEACDTAGESATCDADCTPPACGDSQLNRMAGEDCDGNDPEGGSCVSCAFVCAAPVPSCTDGVRNGDETDVDCGGGCAPCAEGKGCLANTDCLSGSCSEGVCAAVQGTPSMVVSPPSLDFGNVLVGTTSPALDVRVQNTGSAPLVVASSINGAAASEFSVAPSDPFIVLPGQTQIVRVRFAPLTAGAKSATLVLTSNDPSNPSDDIALAGMGL